jgi:hypothetical protein
MHSPCLCTTCPHTTHHAHSGPFPQQPFGFDVSLSFAKQSQVMQFTDPNLVATRTKVLDYFNEVSFCFIMHNEEHGCVCLEIHI